MGDRHMPHASKIGCATLLVLAVACVQSTEPRIEATPSVGVAVGSSPTQASVEQAPDLDTRPDLYVIDPGTGALTRFLSVPGSLTNAESSPDGERVVYESRLPGTPSQIFVVEPDGTRRQLTHMEGGASDPTWSPDGTQIAFAGTRPRPGDPWPDSDIFVMDADGSRIRRFAWTREGDGHPDWSPDGSRIAFHSRSASGGIPSGALWLASVPTRSLTRLTGSHTPMARVDPAWSPDGRWIAYSEIARSTLNGRVYESWLGLMRPNGEHKRRVKGSYPYHLIENPSWSPNGHSIVFEENDPPAAGIRWDGAVGDIGIIDVRTERIRWIVEDAVTDQPSWDPAGILIDSAGASIARALDVTWIASWEPTWHGRQGLDAAVTLTSSTCELGGVDDPIRPGVLTLRFVNEARLEGLFRVARLGRRQRPSDLLYDTPPFMGRRSSAFLAPSSTREWSSSREIGLGRWAIVCWEDRISASNGWQMVPVGVAGPIEIG